MNLQRSEKAKPIIETFIQKGYLLAPEMLESFDEESHSLVHTSSNNQEQPLVISTEIIEGIKHQRTKGINWIEFDKSKVLYEKGRNNKSYNVFKTLLLRGSLSPEPLQETTEKPIETNTIQSQQLAQQILATEEQESQLQIIKSYEKNPKKWEVKDFISYYKNRYTFLQKLLQNRQELQNTISINRIKRKEGKEKISCIGIVYDKRISKNGNYIITLEDPTGLITTIIKPTVEDVDDICLDEVVGVKGQISKDFLLVDELFFPSAPRIGTLKSAPDEAYAAVISDIHVGSENFLEKEFIGFIDWLNLKTGTDQEKTLAKKTKYLFVVGDLVAGNGVYPNQEEDLLIKDLRSQYQQLTEYLQKIRPDIHVIICPGNHDATRLAEPQPPLIKEFTAPLFTIPNATFVSSPAYVNIHASKTFPGFNVLMYHGSSFHYYNNSVNKLREADARNNPRLTWKYLLKKRHLAPAHGSTVYLPDAVEDGLLIDMVPDVVLNGDIHKSDTDTFNGTIIISSSCWEKKSIIQERRGNKPDPGRVPFLNLKTREVTFLDFYKEQ